MEQYKTIINEAYDAFNSRNIGAVLALMKEDVHWPNGWEGGYVEGQNEVRKYWVRQWEHIDSYVTPISFTEAGTDQVTVDVHQIIKDLSGKLLFDGIVKHTYTFDNGLIKRMEIEKTVQ